MTVSEPTASDAPRIPMLGAPTASGKSDLALELAEALGLEVVTADAMQVYRGMDIGTAKPSPAERARVPHHLVSVVDPAESFSVADYVRRAETAIGEVLERGRLPFVVGGTGFYLRALAEGLPTVPAADPALQRSLWAELESAGLDALIGELAAASPADAERAQRNPRRVVRALEVVRRTGRAPSAFPTARPAFRFDKVVLVPTPAALDPRIAARTERMFAAGLVDEVRALRARYPEQPTAMQAIGYKEVALFLEGGASLAETREAVTRATTRYARRQRTWFRREPGARLLEALASEAKGELRAWLAGLAGAGRR